MPRSHPAPDQLPPRWRDAIRANQGRATPDRPEPDRGRDRGGVDDPDPYMHSSELRTLVSRLKSERLRRGLTLADIARVTEQARSAISRLENGRYPNPTLNTVYRYARALGMRITLSAEPLPIGPEEP